MIISKIGICNQALATLGEDSIRDFDEGNTRARMCDVFYESLRGYLLSMFNWPFARRRLRLNMLSEVDDWMPEGTYAYALPADCLTPINIYPEGHRISWEVSGENLLCKLGSDSEVVLEYTSKELDPTKFSPTFANLLAMALAVQLAHPITQDSELAKKLEVRYAALEKTAWALDANIGNLQPHSDDNPNTDSFVHAGMSINPDVF